MARVVGKSAAIAKTTYDSKLNIVAIGPGKWGDGVGIAVEEASLAKDLVPKNAREEAIKRWVKITINFGTTNEVYDNLTLEQGKSNNVATTINAASRLVRVWLEDGLQPDDQLAHSPITDVPNEQDPSADPLKAPELEKLKGGLDVRHLLSAKILRGLKTRLTFRSRAKQTHPQSYWVAALGCRP